MKPFLARKNGRWYIWKDREANHSGQNPLGISGRKTPSATLKAMLSIPTPA